MLPGSSFSMFASCELVYSVGGCSLMIDGDELVLYSSGASFCRCLNSSNSATGELDSVRCFVTGVFCLRPLFRLW